MCAQRHGGKTRRHDGGCDAAVDVRGKYFRMGWACLGEGKRREASGRPFDFVRLLGVGGGGIGALIGFVGGVLVLTFWQNSGWDATVREATSRQTYRVRRGDVI